MAMHHGSKAVALAAIACTSCSMYYLRRGDREFMCGLGYAPPITDTALAALETAATVSYASSGQSCTASRPGYPQQCDAPSGTAIALMAAGAVSMAALAVYGYYSASHCRDPATAKRELPATGMHDGVSEPRAMSVTPQISKASLSVAPPCEDWVVSRREQCAHVRDSTLRVGGR